jgi:hypothetical protein
VRVADAGAGRCRDANSGAARDIIRSCFSCPKARRAGRRFRWTSVLRLRVPPLPVSVAASTHTALVPPLPAGSGFWWTGSVASNCQWSWGREPRLGSAGAAVHILSMYLSMYFVLRRCGANYFVGNRAKYSYECFVQLLPRRPRHRQTFQLTVDRHRRLT